MLPNGHVPPVAQDSNTRSTAAELEQQLHNSGLLQHLPALVTAVARQLLPAAGVPAAGDLPSDKPQCNGVPYVVVELRADHVTLLLSAIHCLTPLFSANSSTGASCLLPAQRLAVAAQQYLSTVLARQPGQQDGRTAVSSSQHSAALTASQQRLSSQTRRLAVLCTNAVSAALDQADPEDPDISDCCGRPAEQYNTLSAKIPHAAVGSRHHMECLCLQIATKQLALMMKRNQQASSTVAGPTAERLLSELASCVPAPLQGLLR
jgi:hypothetical protein